MEHGSSLLRARSLLDAYEGKDAFLRYQNRRATQRGFVRTDYGCGGGGIQTVDHAAQRNEDLGEESGGTLGLFLTAHVLPTPLSSPLLLRRFPLPAPFASS